MATSTVTTRSYPKRKRAEISYHESSSDEGEVDEEYGASDEEITSTTRKKLKASRTTVSTKPLHKRKIFPFTSLPAEIKNQIYALALEDPGVIFLVSKTVRYRRTVQRSTPDVAKAGYHHRRRNYLHVWQQSQPSDTSTATMLPTLTPNILLLNRAIYAEAQPILYASNAFALEDTTALHAFLAIIGPKNRATITDLTIKGWGYTRTHKALNHPALTMLACAANLKHLYLDCRIHRSGPKGVAKQLYRDGFHWLEAVGAAKGKFDAAIEIIEVSDACLRDYKHQNMQADEKRDVFKSELRRLLR